MNAEIKKLIAVGLLGAIVGAGGVLLWRGGADGSELQAAVQDDSCRDRVKDAGEAKPVKEKLVYEATSEFTIDTRRACDVAACEEIFNTRLHDWRGEAVVTRIVRQFRAAYPSLEVTDKEIRSTLGNAKLVFKGNSRIVTITVRSQSPILTAALANVYAEAIEAYTDEDNIARCDRAVAGIHASVEKKRLEADRAAKRLLDFRTAHKADDFSQPELALALGQLEAEFNIANDVLKQLILNENKARLEAEQSGVVIRIGRLAGVPTRPVRES